MNIKRLEGYTPNIKSDLILEELFTKYSHKEWVLSKEEINKKRNSWFGSGIWKHDSFRKEMLPKFSLKSGIVLRTFEIEVVYGTDLKDEFRVKIHWMGIDELLEKIVLLKNQNKIMFTYDSFKGKNQKKIIKVTEQEIQFFEEFFEKCISLNNSEVERVKKVRSLNEQKIKESRTKYDSKKSEFLKKYDQDNNGTIDIIEGDDVFMKLFKKHQNIITETDKDYVHKFVKLSGYLKTKRKNIQQTFTLLKNNQFSDNSSSLTRPERIMKLLDKGKSTEESIEIVNKDEDIDSIDTIIELIENQIYFYNLVLFHSLNMINSVSSNDLITFYEIYEYFDKLNLFNSNWENEVSQKLTNIRDGITDIGEKMVDLMITIDRVGMEITNEIKDLNYTTSESFKDLKNSMVKELNEINSSLDFNVLLNGIQTYQLYKINKNTKFLR